LEEVMAAPSARFILNVEQRVYVEKAWGHEDWIYNGRYCGKKLHVIKGKACSFHYHKVKDEVMYLESGKIVLTYGWDEDLSHAATITLTPDMAFHIPPGMWHRFQGVEDSVITEFSTHHNDKDVVRAGQAAGAENDDEEANKS
jgi:mannose-6-phosphate isomerase-like protein (cupin superfamily)